MRFASRALDRVRALLVWVRSPGGSTRITPVPASGPHPTVPCPSPDMWGAILAGARRRRAPHLWPVLQRPAIKDDSVIDAPVRAYVLPEDERTRPLACAAREVR
jgi:hypothetical protein